MSEDQVTGPDSGSQETTQPHNEKASRQTPPSLTRGSVVAGGRYRLEAPHGGGAGMRYWQARDLRLGRDVALIFVDPPQPEQSAESSQSAAANSSADTSDSTSEIASHSATTTAAVLDRSLALSRLWAPALAGVLDVVRGKVGGIIVAEWTPGRPLAEAAADKKLANSAGAALRPLADAAQRVSDADAALGLISPDQVRITPDGMAVLAFPGVPNGASTQRDVQGLGAVLYAMQTGTWPQELPPGASDLEVSAKRLPPARREGDSPVDPQKLGASASLSALAMRALDGSSVSSPGTVSALLEDDAAGASGTTSGRLGASATSRDAQAKATQDSAGAASRRVSTDDDDSGWSEEDFAGGEDRGPLSDEERRKKQQRQWTIMAVSGAVAVIVIIVLLVQLMGGFGGRNNDTPLADQLDALQRQAEQSRQADAADAEEGGSAPASGNPVEITDAEPWQPSDSNGNAENAATAANVFDGDNSTGWQTDTYRSQFGSEPPAYKEGLGLLLTLDEAVRLTSVEVTSPDSRVRIEVRAVDSASPTSLDETSLLGSGTTSGSGPTDIEITADEQQASRYVLVWITQLAGSDANGYQAQIQELSVEGTA